MGDECSGQRSALCLVPCVALLLILTLPCVQLDGTPGTIPPPPPPGSAPPPAFPGLLQPRAGRRGAGADGGRCPVGCTCTGGEYQPRVECVSRNFTTIPPGLSHLTRHLDLTGNYISVLTDYCFDGFTFLEELLLVKNDLTSLPPHVFSRIVTLQKLFLQQNKFSIVPADAFQELTSLQELHLSDNHIHHVPAYSFANMRALQTLRLDSNQLDHLPVEAINRVPSLVSLTLSVNQITAIEDYSFRNMSNLELLLLYNNRISHIGNHAFAGGNHIKILELDKNLIKYLPASLSSLPALEELSLTDNIIEYLPDSSFTGNPLLQVVGLKNNPIMSVGSRAFINLPRLRDLVLSEARDQVEFPDLFGTTAIETLGLDRCSIRAIPANLCRDLPYLLAFDIHSNHITSIPSLAECKTLSNINLGNNELHTLLGKPFQGLSQLKDLTLSRNNIPYVPEDAFTGLTNLQYLDLQNNMIAEIHPMAFVPLSNLEDLNLGENTFSQLPISGLSNIKNLKTFGNRYLKDFPPPQAFPKVQRLTLSYAYHCCQFITEEPEPEANAVKEEITWLNPAIEGSMSRWHHNLSTFWDNFANMSDRYGEGLADQVYDRFYYTNKEDYDDPGELPESAANYFNKLAKDSDYLNSVVVAKPPINCRPMPGPFMPCDDLMGWWSLRCGVWVVFLLALLGNGCVLLVIFSSRTRLDVPRFLICNLAAADFCMGVYLGFLAIVDASTLGEFKKHAIKWQTSPGCLTAGVFGLLSSELSVYTLTVITLERFYAISHAVHLNKRLSLRNAAYVMAGGWLFSLMMAALPLFGVSDYRKFAICLPFEIGDSLSLGYVCFIMFMNCLAFIIIVSCYTKMYCAIRGSQAWNSHDTRIAKRMALLVFTDFACWAPISFFSITAAFGCKFISLNDAKIFAIFVLPLNSCANPFLYAVFTKQFKKDCTDLCRRLEESTFNRSLSKPSIRQPQTWGSSRRPSRLNTPVNTNSPAVCLNDVMKRVAPVEASTQSQPEPKPTHASTHSDPSSSRSAQKNNNAEGEPAPARRLWRSNSEEFRRSTSQSMGCWGCSKTRDTKCSKALEEPPEKSSPGCDRSSRSLGPDELSSSQSRQDSVRYQQHWERNMSRDVLQASLEELQQNRVRTWVHPWTQPRWAPEDASSPPPSHTARGRGGDPGNGRSGTMPILRNSSMMQQCSDKSHHHVSWTCLHRGANNDAEAGAGVGGVPASADKELDTKNVARCRLKMGDVHKTRTGDLRQTRPHSIDCSASKRQMCDCEREKIQEDIEMQILGRGGHPRRSSSALSSFSGCENQNQTPTRRGRLLSLELGEDGDSDYVECLPPVHPPSHRNGNKRHPCEPDTKHNESNKKTAQKSCAKQVSSPPAQVHVHNSVIAADDQDLSSTPLLVNFSDDSSSSQASQDRLQEDLIGSDEMLHLALSQNKGVFEDTNAKCICAMCRLKKRKPKKKINSAKFSTSTDSESLSDVGLDTLSEVVSRTNGAHESQIVENDEESSETDKLLENNNKLKCSAGEHAELTVELQSTDSVIVCGLDVHEV